MTRLVELDLSKEVSHVINEFGFISESKLCYVPYLRKAIHFHLAEIISSSNLPTLKRIAKDYEHGVIHIDTGLTEEARDSIIIAAIFISSFLGQLTIDPLSGKEYATFLVDHYNKKDLQIFEAYQAFNFHTDGAFFDSGCDWLIMAKLSESYSSGGMSTFLHMEDWEEWSKFYNDKLNKTYEFKGPNDSRIDKWGSYEPQKAQYKKILQCVSGRRIISFIDQFIHPKSEEEAYFLHKLLLSMQQSENIYKIPLKPGEIIILNNRYWVHGRTAFEKNNLLKRELLRMRGVFN